MPNWLGELYQSAEIGYVTHKFLHGLLAFGLGAVSNLKDPLSGGIGGAIGAVSAEAIAEGLTQIAPDLDPQTRGNLGIIGTTLIAFATQQDVIAAGLAAGNAIENNDLAHPPLNAEGEKMQQEQIEGGLQVLGEGGEWATIERGSLVRPRQRLIHGRLSDERDLSQRSQDRNVPWWQRIAYQERSSDSFDRVIDLHMLPTTYGGQIMDAVGVGTLFAPSLNRVGQLGSTVLRAGSSTLRLGRTTSYPVFTSFRPAEGILVRTSVRPFELPSFSTAIRAEKSVVRDLPVPRPLVRAREMTSLNKAVLMVTKERPLSVPQYSCAIRVKLEEGVHYPGFSRAKHFQEANKQLHHLLYSNPDLARKMEILYPGIVKSTAPGPKGSFPSGAPTNQLTWHHHADESGVLELIPRSHHNAPGPVQNNLHPKRQGGMSSWGNSQ